MKRFIEGRCVAVAILFMLGACSSDGARDRGGNEEPTPEPVKPRSLERNPEHPLSCDRPLYQNAASTQLNRLTHEQYANTLRDLFSGIVDAKALPARSDFSDELKEGTFSNNVTAQRGSGGITEQREAAVVKLSSAAVVNLPRLMGCAPDGGDEMACVEAFIDRWGLRAWRRPLTRVEQAAVLSLYTEARKSFDLAASIEVVLGGMLQAPQFLFRVQEGTGEVVEGLGKRLTDHEMASNLSYLLWNTMPDDELFEAADQGELRTSTQIVAQARRMLSDPRARANVHTFQTEWLHVERLEALATASAKSREVFPDFGSAQADAIKSGLDRFLEESFWEGDHSLNEFFTSPHGFVNDASAVLFGVEPPGSQELQRVQLDPTRRRGVLTQPFIMAGWANDVRHSAILRGAYVMDDILCAPSPPPPMDVQRDFVAVPDRSKVTLRQVVEMTVEKGSCAGCHRAIDGFGFLFEHYDAVGAYQTQDGTLDIDASNDVEGTLDLDGHYDDAIGFVQALGKSEQAAQCAVQNLYEFATARHAVPEDGCVIAPLTDAFLKNGTDMQSLLIDIASSVAFRYRSVTE